MKTHWKSLHNYDYLGAYSLEDGKDIVLTIKEVKKEQVTGDGGRKDTCVVVSWVEDQKKMIINKTNSKTIESLYTPFIEDWAGKQVQIFVGKDKMSGEIVDCLRIRGKIPGKPKLVKGDPQWDKAIQYIKDGGSIDNITGKYEVDEKELKKCSTT